MKTTRPAPVFGHEHLEVYHLSIDFVAVAVRATTKLPRGNAFVRDQLRRAAISVPLNIAEASGRPGSADAARHFGIARGSALECAAALDALRVLDCIAPDDLDHARQRLLPIVKILSKLCR
jgi:four helix bundle protein